MSIAIHATQFWIHRTTQNWVVNHSLLYSVNPGTIICYYVVLPTWFIHLVPLDIADTMLGSRNAQILGTREGRWGHRLFYGVMNIILSPQDMSVPQEVTDITFWGHIQHFILLRYGKAMQEGKCRMKLGREENTFLWAWLWPSNILFQLEGNGNGQNVWCLTKRHFTGTLHTSLTHSISSSQKKWKKKCTSY